MNIFKYKKNDLSHFLEITIFFLTFFYLKNNSKIPDQQQQNQIKYNDDLKLYNKKEKHLQFELVLN